MKHTKAPSNKGRSGTKVVVGGNTVRAGLAKAPKPSGNATK